MTVSVPASTASSSPPLWRSEYPFASHRAQVDGHQMHFVDEGKGPVLLLVHGNPTWSFYWRNLIKAWRDRYRVIAVDHLGCGLSDKPIPYHYCLQRHTRNLTELIDQLGVDEITLIGHDWGGAIGLGAAVERSALFRRFVLLNTGAFPPPRIPLRIAVCRFPVLGRIGLQGLNLFSHAALRMASSRPDQLSAATRAGLLAPYSSWTRRIAVQQFVQDIPLTRRHPTYPVLVELQRNLSQLGHVPVQLVWGMRDWCFTPQCLDRLIDLFPEARVRKIPDAGHWVVEDATDEVIEVVSEFLCATGAES